MTFFIRTMSLELKIGEYALSFGVIFCSLNIYICILYKDFPTFHATLLEIFILVISP